MNPATWGATSLSLFETVGGWRTVAESVASRVVFLIAYLLTGHVLVSALVAVGAVGVLALARLRADRRPWPVLAALVTIGVSASLAGSSGQPVDFYLPAVLLQPITALVVLTSMLVRRPLVGVAVEAVRSRGARRGWRFDTARRRRYQRCSAVFLTKDALATAVIVPLYLSEALLPLGVAVILLGGPLAGGACAYLCWRILQRSGSLPTTDRSAPA